jgi:hypothetical protein
MGIVAMMPVTYVQTSAYPLNRSFVQLRSSFASMVSLIDSLYSVTSSW